MSMSDEMWASVTIIAGVLIFVAALLGVQLHMDSVKRDAIKAGCSVYGDAIVCPCGGER